MQGTTGYNGSDRGHRITVIASESVQNGQWNGTTKHDQIFDTYGGAYTAGGGLNGTGKWGFGWWE